MRADPAVPIALWSALRSEGIGRVLRWWWGEAVSTLPLHLRVALWSPRSIALCRSPGGWSLACGQSGVEMAAGGSVWAAVLPPESLKSALDRAFAERPFAKGNVWLALDSHELIVKRTSLPFAAEDDLWSALSLDLDRLTPLSADRAYFALRVVGRDEADKALLVDLAVAPRDIVSPRVAELRGLGLRVVGVGAAADADFPNPMNLLPRAEQDPVAVPMPLFVTRVLAAVAVALALVAMVLPLWQQREATIALQPVLDRARGEAALSDQLARDIERLAGDHNFIVSKKHAQASLAGLVEELSRNLPDDTWVQQFEVKPQVKAREVQIAGETGASSALIATLEKSGALQNATFKSPLTKGSTANSERFMVAAELKSRVLPEPMPDSRIESAKAAPAPPTAEAPPLPLPSAGQPPLPDGGSP